MSPELGISLVRARADLREDMWEGTECPCCGQYARVYRRKVNANCARKLIAAYRLHGTQPFYLPGLLASLRLPGRDESLLHYFRLIQETDSRRDDGGRAGWWRVTGLGVGYVKGLQQIPKYAQVYNGKVLGYDVPMVSIQDALGERFDLQELLAS